MIRKKYIRLAIKEAGINLKNDATSHAEINAICKASKKLKDFDLNGCIIYSTPSLADVFQRYSLGPYPHHYLRDQYIGCR